MSDSNLVNRSPNNKDEIQPIVNKLVSLPQDIKYSFFALHYVAVGSSLTLQLRRCIIIIEADRFLLGSAEAISKKK